MEQLNTLNLLEELDAKTLSAFFKLMSEEIRFQLIFVLVHEKKLCVSDLAKLLNATIATTSHHLQILKKNNLVQSERDSKQVFYYINNPRIIHFVNVGLDFNQITTHTEEFLND